ncbi:MAG: hypothetical protein COA43_14140 [Robiginitomaculum sp.]|nr:MAG: hypothetical protein COA43_14140 [Robiginitomaculum sp.]
MRFAKNGPNIPDELLSARDEGRVIFFCGAGVSLAKAGLPDFYGLTKQVIADLKVQPDSKAFQLYDLPSRVEKDSDGKIKEHEISPFISADRIFGELERDFDKKDIQEAVARCLQAKKDVDLSAHEIVLDLATGPSGRTKLVTTNFDRLFELKKPDVKRWAYPNLPDLTVTPDFDGVVYLHGHTNDNYDGAGSGGFILSSAEFGQAYLADGWATNFIKTMLQTHTIVFLGYSADDPPVRYLLEALGRFNTGSQSVYAFQSGTQSDAEGQWSHKGVTAIAYNPENRHLALWDTLRLWAERAKDPDKWFADILTMAAQSPRKLQPFERGQVAHLVSSQDRSKLLAAADPPLPGEWLYVFDPAKRYAMPSRPYFDEVEEYTDPYNAYSLDSDIKPERFNPNDINRKQREVPENAWSAFALNFEDRSSIEDHNVAAYAHFRATGIANLPKRLFNIGAWIAKMAGDPATLAWCATRQPLHGEIIWQLERNVENLMGDDTKTTLVTQWRYLLEYWKDVGVDVPHNMDWYHLKKLTTKLEWSNQLVRQYGRASRPYLVAKPGYGLSSTAPDDDYEKSIVKIGIEYRRISYDIDVPSEWLPKTVAQLRENLKHAGALEEETGPSFTYDLVPIVKGDDPSVNRYKRGNDLSALMLKYSCEFEKLIEHDVELSKIEMRSWPQEDKGVFSRLRLWAVGKEELVPDNQFISHFENISVTTFWHAGNQRDLLISLKVRWALLSETSRKYIEKRMLKGPDRETWDKDSIAFLERRAWARLSNITWLINNDCQVSFDTEKVFKDLRKDAPEWEIRYGNTAANEMGSRGGYVRTETAHDTLIGKSFDEIFLEAERLRGRTDDFLVKKDPFLGFVVTHPVRALAALSYISWKDSPPIWAWQAFFNHDQRKEDSPRFSLLILDKLLKLPIPVLREFIYKATWWFRDNAGLFSHLAEDRFDKFFDILFEQIKGDEEIGGSKIIHNGETHDWASEAINSSIGHLVDTHFFDSRISSLSKTEGFPKYWKNRLLNLLQSNGDLAALAMAEIAARIQWIHYYEPKLSIGIVEGVLSSKNKNTVEAFWGGYFLSARIPDADLFKVLKPHFIELVESQMISVDEYRDPLAGQILGGWRASSNNKPPYLISDDELTSLLLKGSNEFRSSVIYHAETWSETGLKKESDGGGFPKLMTTLFKDVWPQQITVRTSSVSSSLFSLLISNEVFLLQLYDYVLPLLIPVDENRLSLYFRDDDEIVKKHPIKILHLINAVLPKDAEKWPYGISDVFSRLEKADKGVSSEPIFMRLRKKYESR